MKKQYIKPCARINDSLSPLSMMCASIVEKDVSINPESGQGGSAWPGGGIGVGEGTGGDANDSKRRGFYSAYGAEW